MTTSRPEAPAFSVVVSGAAADAVTVEALARVVLVARRLGWRVVFVGAAEDLRALVHLMGLEDVLDLQADTTLQAGST
jgi:lysylphosphatidylglycerol synthetase-like protein (DUF2156 family)